MIRAIETSYAGYRFRSRLEARWAVALDHLGIRWQYELQGLLCSHRLTSWPGPDAQFPYLPDFWLPDLELHAEVKATLTEPELARLLDAAASLSSNDGPGCQDSGGHDLIVLGNIPPTANPALSSLGDRLPTRLHMHKGDLAASGWTGEPNGCAWGTVIANDSDGPFYEASVTDPATLIRWLTEGTWTSEGAWISTEKSPAGWRKWAAAYTAARGARFEHGQRGA